ncbi:MAG: iron ABC transporter permease [Planctomycetota bacterium]
MIALRRRALPRLALLGGLLLFACAVGTLFRADVVGALRGDALARSFLWDIRLPRTLIALMVGAGLGVAGAVLQGVLRNDLVEPGILGLNAGAECAVLLSLLLYAGPAWAGALLLPIIAWCGGLAAVGLVALLTARRGGVRPTQFLLAGIGVNMLLGGANALLGLMMIGRVHAVAVTWQAGSLGAAGWEQVAVLGPMLALLLPLAWWAAPLVNVIALGDDTASELGVPVARRRWMLIALAVALSSGCVAVGGGIAFAGLLAPHIARRMVGVDYRLLLPATAVVGAVLVLVADVLARTLFLPSLMPTGVLLAVLGVPYFLVLLSRR